MTWRDRIKDAAGQARNLADQARKHDTTEQPGGWGQQPPAPQQPPQQQPPPPPSPTGEGIIFQGMSHEEGRNAEVVLYPNRIERTKQRGRMSLSRAHQDNEVIPTKNISGVSIQKDGIRFSKVLVTASGIVIEFRFGHDEAQRFKAALMNLIL
jgi:hypothetical protein